MPRLRAALGSLVFLVLVPGAVAGVLPWALTGWQTRSPWPPLQVVGLVLVLGGAGVLLHAFGRFVVEGIGTPAPSPSRSPRLSTPTRNRP